ncbi:Sec-independent protein translocase subunit TatA [Kitasatospora sp. NPDC049285]|uniref:Sec-independent protein translocase subunit TatA n=1 Tax=Kitasatospora sp. NPDC049285 TaxID=3157096 RepID=UPI0034353A70
MFRNGLEPWHIIIMVAVLVLLFGSKKLPEMARGLGKSMRILKAETKALREDDAPAEAQNGTATSQAAEQPRPAVEPTVVTKAAPETKSTTA